MSAIPADVLLLGAVDSRGDGGHLSPAAYLYGRTLLRDLHHEDNAMALEEWLAATVPYNVLAAAIQKKQAGR